MVRALDRLAEPRNLRRVIIVFVVLVVLAIALGSVALVRELSTAKKVERVTERVVRVERPPSRAQVRRSVNRAIQGLTVAQRRDLLDRMLRVATPQQLRRLRYRAKVVTRRNASRLAGPAPAAPPARRRPSATFAPAPPPPIAVSPAPTPPSAPEPAPTQATPPVPLPPAPSPAQPPGKGRGKAKGHAKRGEGSRLQGEAGGAEAEATQPGAAPRGSCRGHRAECR